MKENKVEVYVNEGKDHINQNSEEYHLANNDKKEEGGYDKFKNKMKALFKEFERDETNALEAKSSSAINFSEKELKLIDGCVFLVISLIIILICIILIIVFIVIGGSCYFIIPVPVLIFIVSIILVCCNLITISPGYALVLTYYGKYLGTCQKELSKCCKTIWNTLVLFVQKKYKMLKQVSLGLSELLKLAVKSQLPVQV